MTKIQNWLTESARRNPDPNWDALLARLLKDLAGRVVELGCGGGSLFSRYPHTVSRVIAVEPDAGLRTRAISRSLETDILIEVLDATSDDGIPAADGWADVVVCSTVLCSVASIEYTLSEIRRVLRADGTLRILEHVRSEFLLGQAGQALVDILGWPLLLGGCHASRDIVAAIESAGFSWQDLERVSYARMRILTPLRPHVVGTAVPSTTAPISQSA